MMDLALQRKLTELEAHQIAEIYCQVFNTDAGRLILEDLRNRCFVYDSSFKYGYAEQDVCFHEGMRSVMLHIETQLLPHQPVVNQEE